MGRSPSRATTSSWAATTSSQEGWADMGMPSSARHSRRQATEASDLAGGEVHVVLFRR